MVRAEAATGNPLEKTRLLLRGGQDLPGEAGRRGAGRRPVRARAAARSGARRGGRAAVGALLQARGVGAAGADPRDAGAQGRSQDQPRADAALSPPGEGGRQLGDNEKALKYYKQSYDLDSTYLPTLVDRAGAALSPRALGRRVQHLPDDPRPPPRHPEGRSRSSTSSTGSGRIKLKLGERTKAVNMFEKALEIQPGHRATLQAVIDLYTDAGDFEAVIKQKRSLIDVAGDARRREVHAAPTRSPGSTRRSSTTRRRRSPPTWRRSNLKPGDRELLHNLLELFSETKQWKKAMEILLKLAELDSGDGQGALPDRGRQHRQLRAALHGRSGGAVQPGPRRGPRGPEGLRADRQDHDREEGLEEPGAQLPQDDQAARPEPAPDKKQTVVALWHALGEIYRSRLKDYKAAIAAFEVCVQMDPDATARHQILAELYQLSGPETYEQAIKAYRQLIKATTGLRSDGGYLKTLRKLLHGAAPVRQGLVRGGRGVVPAQGRRRGDAVLRAVQAQGASRAPARG